MRRRSSRITPPACWTRSRRRMLSRPPAGNSPRTHRGPAPHRRPAARHLEEARHRRPGQRNQPDRAVRDRPGYRCGHHRRGPRRFPLQEPGPLRGLHRHGTDRGIFRRPQGPPAVPAREPAGLPRRPHGRGHPGPPAAQREAFAMASSSAPGMAIPAARNSCSGAPFVRRRPTWPSLPEHRRHPRLAASRPLQTSWQRFASVPGTITPSIRHGTPTVRRVCSLRHRIKVVERGSPYPAGLLLDGHEVDRLDVRCAGQQVGRHLG
jgi:hypothetical protein